ncbi:MAG: M28 family peptidase [Balneola sp.]
MKTRILPIFALLIFLGCKGPKEIVTVPAPSISDFMTTINAEGLRADLTVLAHDSLEGRDTGSEGLKKAASFLALKYSTLGLKPVGDDGTYFQNFKLNQPITESNTYQVISSSGDLISSTKHNAEEIGNFRTWQAGESGLRGEIVFAGFGAKNDSVNHYPNNLEDKWVMVFYERANFGELQEEIAKQEALGAILIMNTDENSFIVQAESGKEGFGVPGRMSLAYLESESSPTSSVHMVSPSFAAELLGKDNLDATWAEIQANPELFEPVYSGFEFMFEQNIRPNQIQSKNIAAFIEGTDPVLKDEVVVLSSHFDHVGIGRPDSTGDAIYNGADDDGSGTVGLLHVAQALVAAQKAGAGTRRSVLILNVTGEEKGLLGSRYYSDHPIFPIKKTVANLNVDMIGRRDFENPESGDYIYIIGGKIISSGIDSLLNVANMESVNIELSDRYNDLNDPNQFYRRSDHWNFGRLGVPFAFFFNGVHEDYHRPSDEVDKIDFEALTKRAQLIFMTTAKIANANERPEVDNQEFIEKTRQEPR